MKGIFINIFNKFLTNWSDKNIKYLLENYEKHNYHYFSFSNTNYSVQYYTHRF
jgi:hypothetical protein